MPGDTAEAVLVLCHVDLPELVEAHQGDVLLDRGDREQLTPGKLGSSGLADRVEIRLQLGGRGRERCRGRESGEGENPHAKAEEAGADGPRCRSEDHRGPPLSRPGVYTRGAPPGRAASLCPPWAPRARWMPSSRVSWATV